MKKIPRKISTLVIILSFLFFPVGRSIASFEEKVEALVRDWGNVLDRVGLMVLVVDIDDTFYQKKNQDPELYETPSSGVGLNRTHLYFQLIKNIFSRENVVLVYSTARPYYHTVIEDSDEDDSSALRGKLVSLGIDLNDKEETASWNSKGWIPLRVPFDHQVHIVSLPQPDVLITGSGSFIQIGKKLEKYHIPVESFNAAVASWIQSDKKEMYQLDDFMRDKGLSVSPVTMASYSIITNRDVPHRKLSELVCMRDLAEQVSENTMLIWPDQAKISSLPHTQASVQSFPIQNLSINKGVSLRWLLMQMKARGVIKVISDTALCICGDGEGDKSMLWLDKSGFILKPYVKCAPPQQREIIKRLRTLELDRDMPCWMGDIWVCSVIPGKAGLLRQVPAQLMDNVKIKAMPDAESGVVAMLRKVVDEVAVGKTR
ncbi:hypothetical protein ACWJJH_10365 [Endozoicomonadaceae bacterium StTr2]